MKFKNLDKSQITAEFGKEKLRAVQFDREAVDEENRTIELSVSSDAPYERWFGVEILEHGAENIRLERFQNKAAFRDTHFGDQIGVIEKAWIDTTENKLRVKVRFSKNDQRADTLFKDILDGIRSNVSIRYVIHEWTEEHKNGDNGPTTYRVNDWEPIHASLEADPADPSVGVGRNLGGNEPLPEEVEKLKNENKDLKNRIQIISRENEMDEEKEKLSVEDERKRSKAIRSLARDFQGEVGENINLDSEAEKAIDDGVSELDFRRQIMQLIKTKQEEKIALGAAGFNDEKDVKEFRVTRAMSALLGMRNGTLNISQLNSENGGYEFDVSREIAKKIGKKASGIYIPQEVMVSNRDMVTTGQGSHFVPTDLSSNVIEPLQNVLVTGRMGATVLSGLSGDFAVPKITSNPSWVWRTTETTTISDSTPTTGLLSLTPKFGAGAVDISDALIIQSSPSVEMYVRRLLNTTKALGLDLAALHGTGASGQPTGLAGTSGIGSVTIASMDYEAATEFESDVDTGNALDGRLNFATTPQVRASLKARVQESGDATKILTADNKMVGYDVLTSNQISAGYIFFGNWEHLIIAEWGVTDLIVDPYTGARDGLVKLTIKAMADIGVAYAAAFSVGDSFS